MAYGEGTYGRVRWAGYASTGFLPPTQVLPPPVPGGSGAYYWLLWNGFYPHSFFAYAGGTPQVAQILGGVVAVPDASRGVVEVQGWWPNATVLHFVRIHPDGSRNPVRGGYGITISALTRANFSQNPSFEIGLNGVVTDAGTPTLTRITDPGAPLGLYIMRATVAGAGSNGVVMPTALLGSLPVTIGFDARFSVRPTGVRVVVGWADAVGAALATTTVTVPAATINDTVSQFGRIVVTLTPPVGAVTPTVKIIADGVTAGSTMDLDGVTVETGPTDGSRFDGDSLAASWAGTRGLSTSRLAPIQTIVDGECPLDIPVTYVVYNPTIVGGQVTSGSVALPSVGRWCWLTHPLRSSTPMRADLQSVPVLERAIEQGVFWPIGATRGIVVSTQRREPTTNLIFNAASFDDRDELLELMSDGLPLLLRAPATYGYGPGSWWAMGTVTEDREQRLAYQSAMILTAQATTVNTPNPALVYQVTS
jgi:hypothetical protein